LATGKNGNPLAAGKPFINNFLPNGGDMLRLNMAVPATPRDHDDFNSLGIIWAAVLGLTDPQYNTTTDLQFIPNMDGFPNGRRLEDDVTRIELQAVAGIALAAIGLWYDDYDPNSSPTPVTPQLLGVLGYNTLIDKNDVGFQSSFPYVAAPWSGTSFCSGEKRDYTQPEILPPTTTSITGIGNLKGVATNHPNPFRESTTIRYYLPSPGYVEIMIYDQKGGLIATLVSQDQGAGEHEVQWNVNALPDATYLATLRINGSVAQTLKLNKLN
jgi:hypothetical protein